MSITVVTSLECEHEDCRKHIDRADKTKPIPRAVRKEARTNGWVYMDGKDYCPDHKPVWKKVLVPAS